MLSHMIAKRRVAVPKNLLQRISKPYYRGHHSSVAAAQEPEDDHNDDGIIDSFHVLGVPRTFGLDKEELKGRYRRLMTEYHPDKHTTKTLMERQEIEEIASQVTSAYQILQEPHTRATHLLELLGNPMEETSKSDLVGMEFLMQVMEIRESVDTTAPEHLKPIWDETKHHMEELVDELGEAFEQEDYEKAIQLSAQLQYWHRIETAIHEKMEQE